MACAPLLSRMPPGSPASWLRRSLAFALIRRGVRVLTASGDDLTDSSDPSRKMMRQIAGSFAEYEKARLVAKLRGARERKRAESGKCEGRKSWAEINPDLVRRSYQAPNMALASNPNTHIAVVLAMMDPRSRERSLFNLDATIYLYDLTSTYFEGLAAKNGKAKRGYSRDHRPDCKQVVVGLVVNRDGFPITHEIFAGNVQDRASLAIMLDRLGERIGLKQGATVVLDRGMAYDDNLAELKARKLHYVVASRQPERDRWLADFEDTDGFAPVRRQPSLLNPAQKKTAIEVKTRVEDEHTYVLCRSEQRIAKDHAIRSKHEQRLLADIDKLSRRIADKRLVKPEKINQAIGRLKERYPRVARYYNLSHDPQTANLVAALDPDKHAKAERLDGCYLLKTNRKDLSGDELWRIYALLTRAESAFRDMKSPLAERPIFHQLEHRVEAHIFLCVLAYHLLISIEKTLLDRGIHSSWSTVRETLKTHQVCTIVLPTSDGSTLRIRKAATPEHDVLDLYRSLGISHDVIKPQHTWAPSDSD
jgi:transposase